MRKGRRPSRIGDRGKRTRFRLTRKGETALAWVGGIVVLIVLTLLFIWVKVRLFPADPAEEARLAAIVAKDASALQALVERGAVLDAKAGREEVLVDREKWLAQTPLEREQAAGAIARTLGLHRAFFDDRSGARVGWYLSGGGYKEPPKPKPGP